MTNILLRVLICFSLILPIFNCSAIPVSDSKNNGEPGDFQELDNLHKKWKTALNSKKNIDSFYSINAVFLNANNKNFSESNKIQDFYIELGISIKEINVEYRTHETNKNRNIYEMGTMESTNGKSYKYLLIWVVNDSSWKRNLEVICEISSDPAPIEVIDTPRQTWVNLANAHNSIELGKGIYAEHCIYYNGFTVSNGRTDLANSYEYMNEPGYKIDIAGDYVSAATSDLIFEIGTWTYQDTYNGQYIIVWEKQQADSNWMILLDSNAE